ncbi:MAG TPA: hypothetical protein ENI67_02350, partial [Gammaproteobacteria bacterium]|nr:hypothetical protein [Gammaproteobacteria bacterium]
MSDRIKSLSVQGFRGATQPLDLKFDDSKSVILIFGENGTGKSTIVDALECAGNGSTTFLDDWKLGKGKRKESYIPTLGKSLADVRITLEFGNQTYNATLNAKGVQLCNTPARPLIKVLRRKSLQAFIDADPAQRYKEVANFLDIPQIEASEASIRQAYKEAKETFEFSVKATAQAQETLHGLWEAEGSPGLGKDFKNAEAWARKQSKGEIGALEKELAGLKSGVKLIENLKTNLQSYRQAKRELELAETELKQAEERLAAVETNAAKSNAKLVTLLEDAKTYLKASPDTLCPVCEETKIEPENLIQRLDQRITDMASIKQANDAKSQAQKNQQTKSGLLQRSEENLLQAAEAAQAHFEQNVPEQSSIQKQRVANSAHAIELSIALRDDLAARQVELQKQLDATQKQCHTLTSIKQLVSTLDEKSSGSKQAEKLQKKLKQAVEIVEAKRKAYVETILLDIAQAVDSLYQKIHPQENIGQLKLKLDKGQRGSLVYGVTFGEQKDIQPQPYYSESHLDTLGLCIFLALAKRGEAKRTVVVLDDVLGSVDQQHLKRTLGMLLEEADIFSQIVITTHYRPLRNRFIRSRTGSSKVDLLDLKPWTLDKGIRPVTPKLAIDELEALLDDDDVPRSQIAMDAGMLLENMLDHISLHYGLRMTRRPEPLYTLNELYSVVRAIKNWKTIRDDIETEIKPLLDALGENLPVRNEVGAHYNINGELLSDDEIKEFGRATVLLARSLTCHTCSGMPERRDKQAGDWVCQCRSIHMQP